MHDDQFTSFCVLVLLQLYHIGPSGLSFELKPISCIKVLLYYGLASQFSDYQHDFLCFQDSCLQINIMFIPVHINGNLNNSCHFFLNQKVRSILQFKGISLECIFSNLYTILLGPFCQFNLLTITQIMLLLFFLILSVILVLFPVGFGLEYGGDDNNQNQYANFHRYYQLIYLYC